MDTDDESEHISTDDEHSEYLPSSPSHDEDSDSVLFSDKSKDSDSEMSEVIPVTNITHHLQGERGPILSTSNSDKEESSLAENLQVESAKVSDLRNRVWDKKHCCVFCSNMFAKLPRHFEQKHGEE